ncbi:MAG: hypothetical protein AAF399_23885 [Bacteroidota bacterium]
MSPFYQLPKNWQWTVAILGLGSGIGMLILYVVLLIKVGVILAILSFFFMIPIVQFLQTPFMTLRGQYQYVSPMLLVFGASDAKYDLHNGTSFDYWYMMRKVPSGIKARQVMLVYYLQGLLEIIRRLEAEEVPLTLEISGTSYFFSESTAERLGFEVGKPDSGLFFNLIINYLDLLWMYSYAQGKLAFPKLSTSKKAKITGEKLLEGKASMERLYKRLASRVDHFLIPPTS